jgi:hypothetical protein
MVTKSKKGEGSWRGIEMMEGMEAARGGSSTCGELKGRDGWRRLGWPEEGEDPEWADLGWKAWNLGRRGKNPWEKKMNYRRRLGQKATGAPKREFEFKQGFGFKNQRIQIPSNQIWIGFNLG